MGPVSDTEQITLPGLKIGGTGLFGGQGLSITPEAPKAEAPKAAAPAPQRGRNQRPNRYAGACRKCGVRVEVEEGILVGSKGNWGAQHLDGVCEPVEAKPVKAKPGRTNRYAGKCDHCEARVEAEAGLLSKADDGKWVVFHRKGECVEPFPFPNGRYAVENAEGILRFYHAAADGNLYVMASDVEHLVTTGRPAVLAKIEADPEAASRAYGMEIGKCGVCNRTLTDKASQDAGIGPVCEKKGLF